MNIKHVMSYVSFAGYNLIGHVENWTDNQREHALEARVKALEQRRLQNNDQIYRYLIIAIFV